MIVAITGASGAVYGVRLLELLRGCGVESHLGVSPAGWLTIEQELERPRREIESLADVNHGIREIGATIAERARAAGIEECYFDRGGFLYHGKVKALADAAREGGLRF